MCIELDIHRTTCETRESAIIDMAGTTVYNPFRAPPPCEHGRAAAQKASEWEQSGRGGRYEPPPPKNPTSIDYCPVHGGCCTHNKIRFCNQLRPCGTWKTWYKVLMPFVDWLGNEANMYTHEGVYPETLWEHREARAYIMKAEPTPNDRPMDAKLVNGWAVREEFFAVAERLRAVVRELRGELARKNKVERRGGVLEHVDKEGIRGKLAGLREAVSSLGTLHKEWDDLWASGVITQPYPTPDVLRRPRGLNMHLQGPGVLFPSQTLDMSPAAVVDGLRGVPAESHEPGLVVSPWAYPLGPFRDHEPDMVIREREIACTQLSRRIRLLRNVVRYMNPLNDKSSASADKARKHIALGYHRLCSEGDTAERVFIQDLLPGIIDMNSVGSGSNQYSVYGGRLLIVRQSGSFMGCPAPQMSRHVRVRELIKRAAAEYRKETETGTETLEVPRVEEKPAPRRRSPNYISPMYSGMGYNDDEWAQAEESDAEEDGVVDAAADDETAAASPQSTPQSTSQSTPQSTPQSTRGFAGGAAAALSVDDARALAGEHGQNGGGDDLKSYVAMQSLGSGAASTDSRRYSAYRPAGRDGSILRGEIVPPSRAQGHTSVYRSRAEVGEADRGRTMTRGASRPVAGHHSQNMPSQGWRESEGLKHHSHRIDARADGLHQSMRMRDLSCGYPYPVSPQAATSGRHSTQSRQSRQARGSADSRVSMGATARPASPVELPAEPVELPAAVPIRITMHSPTRSQSAGMAASLNRSHQSLHIPPSHVKEPGRLNGTSLPHAKRLTRFSPDDF